MTVLSEIDTVEYFKELPFYNTSIEKPKIKCSKNIDLLVELPFYKQLSIIKTDQAFSGYAMSYKVEIIEKKDPILHIEASKSSTKDLFTNLLNETTDFKYQITVHILLKKNKPNGEIELAPVYFNSLTKLVINNRFRLKESYQEILCMIDAWINNGSGWITESIESEYINVSVNKPLLGNSYINLPTELQGPKKGLSNIKNKDQKCFLWCHVRHINPSEHPGKI